MLIVHPKTDAPADGPIRGDAVWLDLFEGTPEEQHAVTAATGMRVPSRDALDEIESSSRLAFDGNALRLSMPAVGRGHDGQLLATSLGFVLTADHLLTVRFVEFPSFLTVAAEFDHLPAPQRCSVGVFLALLEAIVDRLADVLETTGAELDAMSRAIFHASEGPAGHKRVDATLRNTLATVGQMGDRLSRIRDSLLGVARILPFTAEHAAEWMPAALRPRFDTLRRDVASLNDYDGQLSNKVQFLLDATLGFINIEQNNIFKILTIVSVVGIPPTLVAGIYGMNFKGMPELQWDYGYAYGWAVMIASAVVPLLWFRRRGWI